MAKANIFNASIPHDEPIVLRPGVMHRETDAPGNGKHYALPPEDKERADKGDLSMQSIKDFEPRALSHKGLPFALKE